MWLTACCNINFEAPRIVNLYAVQADKETVWPGKKSKSAYISWGISSCRIQLAQRPSWASFRLARIQLLSIWMYGKILDDVGVGLKLLENWDFSHSGRRNSLIFVLEFDLFDGNVVLLVCVPSFEHYSVGSFTKSLEFLVSLFGFLDHHLFKILLWISSLKLY